MEIRIVVRVPGWVVGGVVPMVLFYRRIRYGYSFRRIPLSRGKFAIVDAENYKWLSKYKWTAQVSCNTFYARRKEEVDGKIRSIAMHREIMIVPEEMMVDHKNHNGLDNRIANLRPATVEQNAWNRSWQKHGSKYKGVTWHKRQKKWNARIRVKYEHINLGSFGSEIEAAKAYDKAARNFRGEFAALNFAEKDN